MLEPIALAEHGSFFVATERSERVGRDAGGVQRHEGSSELWRGQTRVSASSGIISIPRLYRAACNNAGIGERLA
jgi:hypothetical protein